MSLPKGDELLTRDQFREYGFIRDNHQCVVCKAPAVDFHHLVERRLWGENCGQYLYNGVSVCEEHHLAAERTTISCDELRNLAGIPKIILPDHFDSDDVIDKWGNHILPNGMRTRGELFNDESVQKVLAEGNVLHLFTTYCKYPRTFHLPWSPGASSDDKILPSTQMFDGREVVVSVKLDGENSSLYRDHYHARSLTYRAHPSRHHIKQLHASMCQDIPEGWRLCGENLFATHSIHYKNLPAYLLLFSIWNHHNICLSWDETVEWAELFGLPMVPVLYRGEWNEKLIRNLYPPTYEGNSCEGYVVRLAGSFHYRNFRNSVAKYVRVGHVQDIQHHWFAKEVVPNELKKE